MIKQIIALFLFLGFSTSLFAQRTSFRELVMLSERPTIFIDDIILPGNDGKTNLAFIFRFNNDFIPFKKVPFNQDLNAPEGAQFYSTIRLNTEIFEGKLKRREEPSANSVSRDSWTDTLFTSTFEETQSDKLYASGSLLVGLNPREYNFILQLTMMQEQNERNTQRRNVSVPDLGSKKTGEIILIRNTNKNNNSIELEMMNMERNVPFGKNFHAIIRIPDFDENANYTVNVQRAITSRRDTTEGNVIYSGKLPPENIYTNSTIALNKGSKPSLKLSQGDYSYTYALATVPASDFDNAPYFLSLTKEGKDKPVAKTFFRSYWPDMPASLYSLDVSIEMLKFIISEDEIKKINSGTDREREKKFRDFWASKDPTPGTVFNELMAEYYRRIDYAYMEFGSQENPMGHENDQGEIYIKFGPPKSKDRRFPEKGKTIEVWEYPNRTFVFEASTGFGDFVLVGTR